MRKTVINRKSQSTIYHLFYSIYNLWQLYVVKWRILKTFMYQNPLLAFLYSKLFGNIYLYRASIHLILTATDVHPPILEILLSKRYRWVWNGFTTCSKALTLWPLSRSDLLLISPYNNTPNSSITIMRIQEGSPI